MSNFETRVSLAAIVLSVAAFIISVGQALQQYFATAEGYRRCQESVMGKAWAKFTMRRFRKAEFRFETLFSTPHIRIGAFIADQSTITNSDELLVRSRSRLVVGHVLRTEANFERVCWLDFLEDLNAFHTALANALPDDKIDPEKFTATSQTPRHRVDEISGLKQSCLAFPTFIRSRQSWDFMPSDALKPLARIDLCDMAICVRRLGMRWIQFQPHDGLLRVEGKDLILTSTLLRSMGCCINFARVSVIQRSLRGDFMIPDLDADAMGFGLLPVSACSGFTKPLTIGTADAILGMFKERELLKGVEGRMQDLAERGNFFYSFLDIIPLVAPFMRRKGSQLVRIPAPVDRPSWIFLSSSGRTAFPVLLSHHIQQLRSRGVDIPEKLNSLVARCDALGLKFGCWTHSTSAYHDAMQRNEHPIEFLESVHTLWDSTEKYFNEQKIQQKIAVPGLRDVEKDSIDNERDLYADLVMVHLRNAILADSFAERILSQNETRFEYPPEVRSKVVNQRMAETLAQYFYRLEIMRSEMVTLGYLYPDEGTFLELWAHLMVRAFCWHHCHTMVPGMIIPSEYWNSRLPVYIG